MKNKGFTLIELLCVFILLAVIAVITTPVVINIINDNEKTALIDSATSYVSAVNKDAISSDLDETVLTDGVYSITSDGDLCKGVYTENVCTGSLITIHAKNSMPNGGSIIIQDRKVINSKEEYITTLKYDDKSIIMNYDNTYTLLDNSSNIKCNFVGRDGYTDKTGIGAKYICKLDDNVDRVFYVLASSNAETKFIAAKNYIDDNVPALMAWCDQEGDSPDDNSCNHDGLNSYIDYLQDKWSSVNVELPTADEIAHAVGADNTLTLSWASTSDTADYFYFGGTGLTYSTWQNGPYLDSNNKNSYIWLFDYTNDCVTRGCNIEISDYIYGYWTSSKYLSDSTYVWFVDNYGSIDEYSIDDPEVGGIRPTITVLSEYISK